MNKGRFRCGNCKQLAYRRTKGQQYCGKCGKLGCQKARKNAWRRGKYADDRDYRLNQRASTQAWVESRGGTSAYYRDYRRRRAGRLASAGGGAEQEQAPQSGCASKIKTQTGERVEGSLEGSRGTATVVAPLGNPGANSDASLPENALLSGMYKLALLQMGTGGSRSANSDAILAELSVISAGFAILQISPQ